MIRNLILGLTLAAAAVARQAAAQSAIPTPASVLGFPVGADFKLATYDQSLRYFRALARSSDRIKLVDVGKTSTGGEWILAIISSPANLARLDTLRAISQRLAHPTGLGDEEARRLAREGKPFVDISGGLHASEIAGSQHTIQLAYDLLSRPDDPGHKAILDHTVLLLWPSINPDGQNIVANWYRENVGTPYEVAPLHELYQKYIGHDNNRDAYMLNVVESRVVARTWRDWEPHGSPSWRCRPSGWRSPPELARCARGSRSTSPGLRAWTKGGPSGSLTSTNSSTP
ncbi:MAG TPA: M14 family zinc carboxypeptidase, partial [Gemmatimonadales bacterium]|nr:M14 family zinc carboxypeptidase [Gemmatimonadales bacterium]